MKKLLAVLLAAGGMSFASAASAADYIASDAPYSGVYDWSGFYVGLQAGAGWSRIRDVGTATTFNANGFQLGAHTGYNFQSGSFVFGVEGDVNYNWNRIQTAPGFFAQTRWDWSVRGRLGYAIDRTLIYATGGVAFANMRIDRPVAPTRIDLGFTGWTLGAGVEHAFTNNWTTRVEYRYSDFGRRTPAGFTPVELHKHQLTVGVSYKF